MSERFSAVLANPRGHWATIALAVLLALPCVSDRLVLDDFVLDLQSRASTGIDGLHSRPLDLFRFTDGDPVNNERLMNEGVLLPWWSHPELRVAFFRPLSSLTHWLDFTMLQGHPQWMGVHTLLWWVALLSGLAHVYHRFHGHTVFAGFALLLYAIDDVHGATLGWLSNRNAIIATVLALPALSTLHRARTQQWRPGYWIGPLCFALGLCAGETAVALFAYVLSYALFMDRGSLRERVLIVAPYVAVALVWRVAYQWMGYGAFGSDGYHDPGREPLAFLAAAAMHVPILLAAQFGPGAPPLADLWAWGPPELAPALVATAVVTLLICVALIWPVLKRDSLARFWLFGAVVSVLPSAASVPGERLLIFVGVGATPVIAATLQYWAGRFHTERRLWLWALTAALVVTHLVAAPIGLFLRAGSLDMVGSVIDATDASLGYAGSLHDEQVVIVNPPFDVMVSYLQAARQSRGQVRPKRVHWLATASSELTIERRDAHTLRVTPAHGFIRTVTERHYNSDPEQFEVGSAIALAGMTVTILGVRDGRPAMADFRFEDPLGAPGTRFFEWNGRQLVPFVAPATGQRTTLPADGFFPTLLRNALTMTP